MPQHNPAHDIEPKSDLEAAASEIDKVGSQLAASASAPGEPPGFSSLPPTSLQNPCRLGSIQAPSGESGTQNTVGCAKQHRVRVHSEHRGQVDIDLLIQAILFIAEEMTTPPDQRDAAPT